MASPTKKVKKRRALRRANAGKERKRHDRNKGSTPKSLPLDKPNANELAQKSNKNNKV